VNRFIWPKPPAAGAGAAATVLLLPLNPSVAPPDLEDEDEERDLVRLKSIRFTSERLGLVEAAGGRGGSGHAPPSIPHAMGAETLAAFLLFFLDLDLLRLIWPMHETLGEDASGVRYPLPAPPAPCLLRPRARASGGTMDTIGPEKALRWLNDDLPPARARAARLVVEAEKEAAVDRRNVARAAPAPEPAPLLVLACLLGFLSITGVRMCERT
jgi:hypothetical protein